MYATWMTLSGSAMAGQPEAEGNAQINLIQAIKEVLA